jgi:putative FmdB family regulatory protein
MPFYEYVCAACGKPTTILQKLSDAPATDCPACGQPALSKQISAAGFRLKGAGWYETDFKSGGKKNLVGDAPASSDSGTAAKSETAATPAAAPASTTTPAS